MKKLIIIWLLIFCSVAYAGGPTVPDGYRMPTKEELSLSLRDSDKHRYSLVSADFNGDKLIDGAILAIDYDKKELAIFVFLALENDNNFKWQKIESLPYSSIQYTGIEKVMPQIIQYYPDDRDEKKKEIRLLNESVRLFNFEGSSSVFSFDKKSKQFKRIWISK